MKRRSRLWQRRLMGALGLGIATWLGPGMLASPAASEPDVRRDAVVKAVERVMPSVVNVATETLVESRDPLDEMFRQFFGPYYRRRQPNMQYSLGSGVIIDEEGFVLTNFHVVNRASRVRIRLADGREFECERVSGTSVSDLALLKINAPEGETFTAVQFAADDDLLLGETVLALGNPFGLGGSVSRGILSSKSRRPPKEDEPMDVMDWLQTDAAINPGNSGGPLVNLRGELIGINVAIYREAEGIGFAIPVKRVAQAVAEIYSTELLKQLWFGAHIRPGNLPLKVVSVQADSPAAKAELQSGDEILKVNGEAPRSFIGFIQNLLAAGKGQDIKLVIRRNAAERNCTLRLEPESAFFNSKLVKSKTGASVQELTPEIADSLGLPRVAGILISDVEKGSPAADARLQPGMVITAMDGQEARDVVALARRLKSKSAGDRVRWDILAPIQRGIFLRISSATVEITLR